MPTIGDVSRPGCSASGLGLSVLSLPPSRPAPAARCWISAAAAEASAAAAAGVRAITRPAQSSPLAYSISVSPVSAQQDVGQAGGRRRRRWRSVSSAASCSHPPAGRHRGAVPISCASRFERQLIAEAAEAANHAVRGAARRRSGGGRARGGRCWTGAPRSPARRTRRARRGGRSRCGYRRRR